MSGKLVALVDGSDYSRSVCEHAAWLATRSGRSVELLHVIGRRSPAAAPTPGKTAQPRCSTRGGAPAKKKTSLVAPRPTTARSPEFAVAAR